MARDHSECGNRSRRLGVLVEASDATAGLYSNFAAFATLRLEAAPACSAAEAQTNSARLLDAVWQLSEQAAYDLRWLNRGDGVECLLLVRVEGYDRKDVIGEIRKVVAGVLRVVDAMMPGWSFRPLTTVAAVREAVRPFAIADGGDLRRRELVVSRNGDSALRVASFLTPSQADPSVLLRLLAASPAGAVLSMAVAPLELDGVARAGLQDSLSRIEDALIDPLGASDGDGAYPAPQNDRAPVTLLAPAARTLGMRLTQPERTASLRVSLASAGPLDRALVSAAAAAFGAGVGAVRFLPATESAERASFARNLDAVQFFPWGESNEDYGSRCYLAVVPEAQAALRLPSVDGGPALCVRAIDPAPHSVPTGVPQRGTPLGCDVMGRVAAIGDADRSRHTYVIGQTGTGKSTLLLNSMLRDVKRGMGLALIDPHGDLADDFLDRFPEERADDLVLFDASDAVRPIGLNLFDVHTDWERDFVIQDIIGMLYRMYDPGHTGIIGPRFEHWLRSAAVTLMSGPQPGTFIDVPRLFLDEGFLASRLADVRDPFVRMFWLDEMSQTSDFHKSEMRGWFVAKWGAFMSNAMMRRILGQTNTTVRIDEIMRTGKVLVARLPKGEVGEINMSLLGMILLNKLQMAAMGRAGEPTAKRTPFALYVDEFQNFALSSFESMIAEARKYGLHLTLAHQHLDQCPDRIRKAVLGNVSNKIVFRLGLPDALLLEGDMDGAYSARDLTRIENFRCVIRMAVEGRPVPPFDVYTEPAPGLTGDGSYRAVLKQLSALKYGVPSEIVEAEVSRRFSSH